MRRTLACSLCLFFLPTCSYDFNDKLDGDTIPPSQTQTDTETQPDSLTDQDTQTQSSSDSYADTGSQTSFGSDTADSGSDTTVTTDTSENTGSGDTETETPEDTGDTGSGLDTSSGSDTGSSTDPLIELYFHFWERIDGIKYYGTHELHIGPATSTDPTDHGWSVIADSETLYNTAANTLWARSEPIDLSAYRGQTVRLALRFMGGFVDDWYVDDLCVSEKATSPKEADCLWWEDFDSTQAGVWPQGFLAVAGPENNPDSKEWKSAFVVKHSSPNSASITWTYLAYTDRFLVTAPIVLPWN